MDNIQIKTEIIFDQNWEEIVNRTQYKIVIIDRCFFQINKTSLLPILKNIPYFLFDAKEANKNISYFNEIINFFQKENINREFYIICFGGGITTDIGAFAASTYMRGCKLLLIPTTFLAMIDAAIGGKTAINFNQIKNNVGSFYPADVVIINQDFLTTLPEAEILNGWAECLKVALIDGGDLYEKLFLKRQQIEQSILQEAIKIKVDICNEDLYDNKRRQLLNLGHSVGHIIEVVSDYSISHGISVAIGIKVIAKISLEEKLFFEMLSKPTY